jgi:group I intron endonuclease
MIEGIIYKATNTINGQVYIGATTKKLEKRKQDHVNKALKGYKGYFQTVLLEYGIESFEWEQIDIAKDENELAKKEIQYILEYNSAKEGYNKDKGGGFKKTIYKYNLDGSLNSTYETLTDAGNSINVRKQDVSRACWSANHTLGSFLWSYEDTEGFKPSKDNRKKEVLQYNLNGNLLARYASASEASRKTGISKTCIARCCRKEREHSGGFIWKYI